MIVPLASIVTIALWPLLVWETWLESVDSLVAIANWLRAFPAIDEFASHSSYPRLLALEFGLLFTLPPITVLGMLISGYDIRKLTAVVRGRSAGIVSSLISLLFITLIHFAAFSPLDLDNAISPRGQFVKLMVDDRLLIALTFSGWLVLYVYLEMVAVAIVSCLRHGHQRAD